MLAQRFGIEAVRANPMTAWRRRLPALLAQQGIDTVFDVGANDGGFATELIGNGYRGIVYSFEPLPAAHAALLARSRTVGKGRWIIYGRVALCDVVGEAEFYEAGNSVSSSLLNMSNTHVRAAPASAPTTKHLVTTTTMDDVVYGLGINGKCHLKIDVQGAESMVLAGARNSLSGVVHSVQVEMSLTELYDGQALSGELDQFLKEMGFELWDIVPGFRDPGTFRLLQYDGLYLRQ
jgi:FkbM family methyltransferase